jgi:hemolysin activation/secretion protein
VNDVLSIRVIEARVANVTVKYFDAKDPNHPEKQQHWLDDEYLRNHSPVKRGNAIRKEQLDEYQRLLNVNSDRYVRPVVSPAQERGAVNIEYDVFEASPWHAYTQLDNSGTDTRQWNPRFGLLNTNLTGQDDLLSLMGQVDVRTREDNYAAFGRYERPLLDPRLRVGFFGGISEFDITPESTGGLVNFLGEGEFGGATLRYNVMQIEDWMFDLTGLLSYEVSQIDRSLGVDSDVDMALAGVGFEIHRLHYDKDLQLQKGTSVSFERQENYTGNFDDFQNARFGADPDFIRYSLSGAHWQFMDPKNRIHQVSARAKYIYPTARLVPAKMTTFGGLYTVRGYHEDEIVADGGLLASLEYRFYLSRYLSPSKTDAAEAKGKKAGAWWRPDVSLLAFTDYGRPEIKDPQVGEFDTQNMWGIGLGVVLEIKNNFSAAVYHSWALKETVRPSDGSILTDEGDSQWNFNFILRF